MGHFGQRHIGHCTDTTTCAVCVVVPNFAVMFSVY